MRLVSTPIIILHQTFHFTPKNLSKRKICNSSVFFFQKLRMSSKLRLTDLLTSKKTQIFRVTTARYPPDSGLESFCILTLCLQKTLHCWILFVPKYRFHLIMSKIYNGFVSVFQNFFFYRPECNNWSPFQLFKKKREKFRSKNFQDSENYMLIIKNYVKVENFDGWKTPCNNCLKLFLRANH